MGEFQGLLTVQTIRARKTPLIATVLRSRGYDVVSAHEVDMKGKGDEEQLDCARQNSRALLTFNARHFAPLAERYYEKLKGSSLIMLTSFMSLPAD